MVVRIVAKLFTFIGKPAGRDPTSSQMPQELSQFIATWTVDHGGASQREHELDQVVDLRLAEPVDAAAAEPVLAVDEQVP